MSTTDQGFWPRDDAALRDVIEWAWSRIQTGGDSRHRARPASELEADIGTTITPEGIGTAEAFRRFVDVVVPATRAQDRPLNLAYVPSAPTPAALVFDLAVSASAIFAGIWEAGAGAIHAENQALAWLAGLAGWPSSAGGCFVPGATQGNLAALVAARHDAATRRVEPRPDRWRIAATAEAHSSVRAVARAIDVDVLTVPSDDRGRLTGDRLIATLDGDPIGGDGVFCVVASAGTTNAGVVDELAGIAEVAAERGIWMHVDGAYGGAALAAPSARPLFAGIERADSFVVDPHKWLFAPYDCCALLYRRPELATRAHTQEASYLESVDRERWNPADLAVHLTRRARGLPFWFSLATYGTERYAAAVETVLATTRQIADAIDRRPFLDLVERPDLSVLLFRRPGWSMDDHLGWSDRLAREGVALCIPTRWRDEATMRLCLVNPDTRVADVEAVLDTMA